MTTATSMVLVTVAQRAISGRSVATTAAKSLAKSPAKSPAKSAAMSAAMIATMIVVKSRLEMIAAMNEGTTAARIGATIGRRRR